MNIYHIEMLIKTLVFILTFVIAWVIYVELNKYKEGNSNAKSHSTTKNNSIKEANQNIAGDQDTTITKDGIDFSKIEPTSEPIEKNKKCREIDRWDKCIKLDNELKDECGYCENNETYYYGIPENQPSILTDHQDWDHTDRQPYLYMSSNKKVREDSTCPGDSFIKPGNKDFEGNKVGTKISCQKKYERLACAKATKCLDLDTEASEYGISKKWVRNNCGFCPTSDLKGIVIGTDGNPKYDEDRSEDCGDQKNKIPFIKYDNNINPFYLDIVNQYREKSNQLTSNDNITCNDIVNDNPCIGASQNDLISGKNNCYEWLYQNYAKGYNTVNGKAGAGVPLENCTNTLDFYGKTDDKGMKLFNELGVANKNWYEIKKGMDSIKQKISSSVYDTAKNLSNYCFGKNTKLDPCHPDFNVAGGKKQYDCAIKYHSRETMKNLTHPVKEGLTCTNKGIAHPDYYKDDNGDKNSIGFDGKAGFLKPWSSHTYNKKYGYADYNKMKKIVGTNEDKGAELHSKYSDLLDTIKNQKNSSAIATISNINDSSTIDNYLSEKFKRVACTGEVLDDKKYLGSDLKVDCWDDFAVKMIASGYFEIVSKNPPKIKFNNNNGGVNNFNIDRLKSYNNGIITKAMYDDPTFPILNYIKLMVNISDADRVNYIKTNIIQPELDSGNGWEKTLDGGNKNYYVIRNTNRMSEKFKDMIGIVPILNGNTVTVGGKNNESLVDYIKGLVGSASTTIGYIAYKEYQNADVHKDSLISKPNNTNDKTDKYIIPEEYIKSAAFPYLVLIKRNLGL